MNPLLDDFLVACVLLASLGCAVAKLGPRTVRKRIFSVLSRLLACAPAFIGLQRAAQRLAKSSGKSQAACGGCDNCGSEAQVPGQHSEVKVPVAKIGRRG